MARKRCERWCLRPFVVGSCYRVVKITSKFWNNGLQWKIYTTSFLRRYFTMLTTWRTFVPTILQMKYRRGNFRADNTGWSYSTVFESAQEGMRKDVERSFCVLVGETFEDVLFQDQLTSWRCSSFCTTSWLSFVATNTKAICSLRLFSSFFNIVETKLGPVKHFTRESQSVLEQRHGSPSQYMWTIVVDYREGNITSTIEYLALKRDLVKIIWAHNVMRTLDVSPAWS